VEAIAFLRQDVFSMQLAAGSALLLVALIATSPRGAFIVVAGLCQGVTLA